MSGAARNRLLERGHDGRLVHDAGHFQFQRRGQRRQQDVIAGIGLENFRRLLIDHRKIAVIAFEPPPVCGDSIFSI
jgi:hypothetical protein